MSSFKAMKERCMNKCKWKFEGEYWLTSCDNAHVFEADGPEENHYKFCPYCGSAIKIIPKESEVLSAEEYIKREIFPPPNSIAAFHRHLKKAFDDGDKNGYRKRDKEIREAIEAIEDFNIQDEYLLSPKDIRRYQKLFVEALENIPPLED